jgi:hypothetical protein
MSETEPQWLQHPEDRELYFDVVGKRTGVDGHIYWDTFQVVDNNREKSAEKLKGVIQRGFDMEDMLPIIGTQVINTVIEGTRTKIVLHIPMMVEKEKILNSKDKKVAVGDCQTPFYASHIH